MQAVEKFGPVVGRILLALIFLMSGINKVLNWEGTEGYMASVGMPWSPFFSSARWFLRSAAAFR